MTGIDAIDVALPRYRVDAETVRAATGSFDARIDARALPGNDEDAVTLGVDAARGLDLAGVDLLAVASTTRPQPGSLAAGPIARALGIHGELRSMAFGGSWQAGLEALEAAIDLGPGLAVAAETPVGSPDSAMADHLGAGAAAVRTGDGRVAELVGAAHHVDARLPARFVEDGAVTDLELGGYTSDGVADAVAGVASAALDDAGLSPEGVAHVVLPQEDVKAGWRLGARLGFDEAQRRAGWVVSRMGFAGAATPLLGLATALGASEPGDRVLVTAYGHGEGATALCFAAAAGVADVTIDLDARLEATSTADGPRYLALRGSHP